MGTTNILDLNNRLTKVEKENVAQNSYTSLKNKPKINNITLTGNKSLADIGAAAATDVGDITQLNTTNKSSTVAAINELNGGVIASVIADGVKTYSALFDELYALVSNATVLYPSRLKVRLSTTIFQVSNPRYEFSKSYLQGNGTISTSMITMKSSGSLYRQTNINTSGASSYDNLDTVVPPNNLVISIIY